MNAATKKWISRLVKFGVCLAAILYLKSNVSLEDTVKLRAEPDTKHAVVSHTDQSVTILDAKTGLEREVPWADVVRSPEDPEHAAAIERGLKSIMRQTDWSWAGWALLAFGPATFCIAWRLRLLLKMQSISIRYRDSLLLTFAGNFFNFAMPGTTGGDLYKAYHIAKRTHKRAEGITVVFLDRVIGLISFLLLSAVAIFLAGQRGAIGPFGTAIGYSMLAFFVSVGLFFSRRVRRWIRYENILKRLPFADTLRRVDETAFNFRYHPRYTLVSLVVTVFVHFFFITAVYLLARGLGIHPSGEASAAELYLAIFLAVVVGYLFAAIPISIQGFGLLEAVFIRVLVEGGWCGMSEMFALALGARLVQVVWALPGVVVPWLGFGRPPGDTADEAFKDAEASRDEVDVGVIGGAV